MSNGILPALTGKIKISCSEDRTYNVTVVALLGSVLVALAGPVACQTKTDPKMADTLIAKEKTVLEAPLKNDGPAFNAQQTGDPIFVGEEGFSVAKIDTTEPVDMGWAEYKPSDFKVIQPDSDTALVMFKNWIKFKNGQTEDSYQTSLWVKRNGEWRILYHADIHPNSGKKDESAH